MNVSLIALYAIITGWTASIGWIACNLSHQLNVEDRKPRCRHEKDIIFVVASTILALVILSLFIFALVLVSN